MKCALLDKNDGNFKETPAGSLLEILNPLSAVVNNSSIKVDQGNNFDVNTTAPFGATQVKAFTVCLLL